MQQNDTFVNISDTEIVDKSELQSSENESSAAKLLAAALANNTVSNPTELSVDDVIGSIGQIATGDKASFNVEIVKLGPAIGELDRAYHLLIEGALVAAGMSKTDAKSFIRGCVADAKGSKQKKVRITNASSAISANNPSELPTIQMNNRQLFDVIKDTISAMAKHNSLHASNPISYIRGGTLARITQDERGSYRIHNAETGDVAAIMSQIARWVKIKADKEDGGDIVFDEFVSGPLISAFHSWRNWPGTPGIKGITNVPVFSCDGELHSDFGYNPATKMFYTGEVTLGDTTPTPENIEFAKKLIEEELLVDFPFKSNADRDNAIALFIAPYCRPMIAGPTPMTNVEAPKAGTGKGLLCETILMPALGKPPKSTQGAETDDEWRKRITAELIDSPQVVFFDNVNGLVDSKSLASALTQSVWGDRVLGSSRNTEVDVNSIWLMTGNNPSFSDEMARRVVWVRLDANMEKPDTRKNFKHENLKLWVVENRDELVTAAITLVRAWIDAGRPAYTGYKKGSFEQWSSIVGGILEFHGYKDFLTNEAERRSAATEDSDLHGEFVRKWFELYGTQKVGVGKLFQIASKPDASEIVQPGEQWFGILDSVLGAGSSRSRQIRLGKQLSTLRDGVVGDYKIIHAGMSGGESRYQLIDVSLTRPIGGWGDSAQKKEVDW